MRDTQITHEFHNKINLKQKTHYLKICFVCTLVMHHTASQQQKMINLGKDFPLPSALFSMQNANWQGNVPSFNFPDRKVL